MVLTNRFHRRSRRARGGLVIAGHTLHAPESVSRGIHRMRHGQVPWQRRSRHRLALRLHHRH
jgi:hypothetical protein